MNQKKSLEEVKIDHGIEALIQSLVSPNAYQIPQPNIIFYWLSSELRTRAYWLKFNEWGYMRHKYTRRAPINTTSNRECSQSSDETLFDCRYVYFSYFFILMLLLSLGSKAQKRGFFWSASKIKCESENDLNKWQILSHAKSSSMRCTFSPKLILPKSISTFEPEHTGFKTELVAVPNLRKPGLNLVHQISQILTTLLYGCPRLRLTPFLVTHFLTPVAQIQATKLVPLNSSK